MAKLVECKSCKHKVDPSAKTCPSCGVSKPGIKGWQGCLGIIVFAVLFAAFMGADKKPLTVEEQQQEAQAKQDQKEVTCKSSTMAQVMAKEFVKKSLKSPSTADFPFLADSVAYLGDCTHVVKSHVDAQNSFGAMIRTETTVKLRYDKAMDNWFIVDDTAAPIPKNTEKTNHDLTQAVPPANDKKPENTQGKLSDDNLNQFLLKYLADYSKHNELLLSQFAKYKTHDDYQGFALFKNNEWHPDYDHDRHLYDTILEDNRIYLMDNDLVWLFVEFDEMTLTANALWKDLRSGDKAIREGVRKKVRAHIIRMHELFEKRGLKEL
ncbi:zinc ribbon domain-containing protein [Methylobacter tundripaludum]|uniref:zinc ribbon domain-containing protein n=1 Tax=Methylobacter tundripaludum TaxID=173365 RepID=UPI0004DF1D72|nr:zinc ribbon domain-containing protein [Methylobacter tundripaludum]